MAKYLQPQKRESANVGSENYYLVGFGFVEVVGKSNVE
jgi:hypothetical protein